MERLLRKKRTLIMGILNVTPDSFSDGGKYLDIEKAITHIKEMLSEGTDIIDIGAESTRPGAESVGADEELQRLLPVIDAIRREIGNNVIISVDTYKSRVAKEALKHGANLINCLGSLLLDTTMANVVKEFHCPIIFYHIKGEPRTMQQGDIAYKNVVEEITLYFEKQIAFALDHGIKKAQILIDPGIGFGKSVEDNLKLIKHLDDFQSLELPIVIGVSRKSHLGKVLQRELGLADAPSPSERLEASLAETAVAVIHGAKIVRTHDVKETKRFVTVLDAIMSS